MRQIILDTETTGLEHKQGHKIIEIGCVEMINRRKTDNNYHQYINPEREIDDGAIEVHGITNEALADKPKFRDIAQEFIDYIRGAELVIHNAPFDVGFINAELSAMGRQWGQVEDYCTVVDTLTKAREMHPGQKNSLDALCKRYEVDNSQRDLHGALLDARILLDVYLAMTGGQAKLMLDAEQEQTKTSDSIVPLFKGERPKLKVIKPNDEEKEAHQKRMELVEKEFGSEPIWYQLELDR